MLASSNIIELIYTTRVGLVVIISLFISKLKKAFYMRQTVGMLDSNIRETVTQ